MANRLSQHCRQTVYRHGPNSKASVTESGTCPWMTGDGDNRSRSHFSGFAS